MARTPLRTQQWLEEHRVGKPAPGRRQDLTGLPFGHLTVVAEQGRNKHNNVLWLCNCACGRTTTATTTVLKSGKKISCGCKQYRKGAGMYNWTGCGEIPGSYLCQARSGAKARGIAFDVSSVFLWELFLRQERRCALSGLPLSFADKTASLDRKDSDGEYTESNVQWVHKDVNKIKVNFPEDRFRELCTAVSTRRWLQLRLADYMANPHALG